MKRSISQHVTGERISHPEADPELYDLLALVSGPWTEARFRVAPTIVVRARHWMTYVESLKDIATLDVKSAKERLDDEKKALSARTAAARESLAKAQIRRAAQQIRTAKQSREQARAALLLDEDALDGN